MKTTTETKSKKPASYDCLTNVERAAIAKATGACKGLEEDVAKAIPQGTYDGEVDVRIKFMLTKHAPTEAAPTANLLSKAMIAKAAVQMGAQADNFFAALRKVALEELTKPNADVSAALTEADERVVLKLADLERDVISKLPKATRSGQTKVIATITRLTPVVAQDEPVVQREVQPHVPA